MPPKETKPQEVVPPKRNPPKPPPESEVSVEEKITADFPAKKEHQSQTVKEVILFSFQRILMSFQKKERRASVDRRSLTLQRSNTVDLLGSFFNERVKKENRNEDKAHGIFISASCNSF